MIAQFDSLIQMMEAFPDEQACLDHLQSIRWAHGEFCPYCGHDKVYHFTDKRTFKCASCRQRFSLKVGTIFEDSKLPLRKWFMAIWLITSHKKGIASTQLARDLSVTQKTAWFMLHRLRHAARTRSFNRPLRGTVEADESFFGGKDKNKPAHKRGQSEKVIAFGLLERGGELRVTKIDSLRGIKRRVASQVAPGSNVMTDEYPGYHGLSGRYHHHTVNHSIGEYVRHYFNHVNGIEGAWSLFKRQVYGIHHWVSGKHLDRYLAEMTWRYNRRRVEDGPRMNEFLARVDGRLTYAALIGR